MLLTVLMTLLGVPAGAGGAQGWPTWPNCPKPLAASPWSMSESPTRAIIARQWFAALQAKVGAARLPTVLIGLAANEPVTLCRIASSVPATVGLGRNADVAVIVVSASATEEVVHVDSSMFEVYLAPSYMADASDETKLVGQGPSWPLLGVAVTPTSAVVAFSAAAGNAFERGSEFVAFASDVPDQPGVARQERLVLSDACGRVAVQVGMRSGVIRVLSGSIDPSSCKGGAVRSLLGKSPRYSVTARALALSRGSNRVVLSRSPAPSWRTVRVLRYHDGGVVNEVAADATTGDGGLRTLGSFDGCNWVTLRIAFASKRFVLDPDIVQTARACLDSPPSTAIVPFMRNPTGTGTWTVSANTLILRFLDGATAEFEVAG